MLANGAEVLVLAALTTSTRDVRDVPLPDHFCEALFGICAAVLQPVCFRSPFIFYTSLAFACLPQIDDIDHDRNLSSASSERYRSSANDRFALPSGR